MHAKRDRVDASVLYSVPYNDLGQPSKAQKTHAASWPRDIDEGEASH